jgi:glutamyl-tRNA synthetase
MALFNYAFARSQGGAFILRIEDTDQSRARADSEQMIFDALRWTGLSWDEGPDVGGPHAPYRQSERGPIYREHAAQLLASGAAYRCFCTEERLEAVRKAQGGHGYDRHCRDLDAADGERRATGGEPSVVRFKVPLSGPIVFKDHLRADPIVRDAQELTDQVLLKSDGLPTYHLANVVDDHLMEISHVIRAEEWISSTQLHVLLYRAFGWDAPVFAHMPLLRNADKSKISKRKNPVSINYYRDIGILPQALLNFLANMGWSYGGDREKFTLAEMIEVFTWDRISLGEPVFDLAKLTWLNEQYLHAMSYDEIADALVAWRLNRARLAQLAPLVRERIKKLDEFIPATEFLFSGELDYAPVTAELAIPGALGEALLEFIELFEKRSGFEAPGLEEVARAWSEAHGWKPKHSFMVLRVAITGRTKSPGLFETMVAIGKEIVRWRLRRAAQFLAGQK